jgi:hypothetical protein
LIDPVLDGDTFAYKVDNGEGVLSGKLAFKGDTLQGRWTSADGALAGILEMSRKE